MTEGELLGIVGEAMQLAWVCAAPGVLAALVGGLLVGLLQAVTQIRDSALAWVPRMVLVALVLTFVGDWMLESVRDATLEYWSLIRDVG